MESYLTKLELVAESDTEQKILDIFIRKAGNKVEKKSELALNLMTEGKTFGRALAEALEKK